MEHSSEGVTPAAFYFQVYRGNARPNLTHPQNCCDGNRPTELAAQSKVLFRSEAGKFQSRRILDRFLSLLLS
jgi:hypothetical protein